MTQHCLTAKETDWRWFRLIQRWITTPSLTRVYLIFAVTIAAGFACGHWIAPWGTSIHSGWAGHLLRWDGLWYRDIAEQGYRWDNRNPKILQNVAFFPLYPLIEAGLMRIVGTNLWLTSIIPGVLFGLWSIAAFFGLAETICDDRKSALRATMFYALWPASSFYFNGYPTGLINLCAIAAIRAILNRRPLRSGFWCGLGTAAAPTMVFFAIGLCLTRAYQWWQHGRRLSETPALTLFAGTSVWGLLLLMAFFAWQFGNPLLFVAAQDGWGVPAPFSQRFLLLADPLWYFYPFIQTFALLHETNAQTMWTSLQFQTLIIKLIQKDIDGIALIAIIAALIVSRRVSIPLSLRLTGLTCLIGYLWFLVAIYTPFFSGVRLLFPALLLFIISSKVIRYNFIIRIVYLISSFILVTYIALIYAGYPVI